jgi:hypothetical protein
MIKLLFLFLFIVANIAYIICIYILYLIFIVIHEVAQHVH